MQAVPLRLFLRDQADEPTAKAELRALVERIRGLRALLAVHRPDLRRGESLFAEYDSYDFAGMRHETLHGLEVVMDALQRKLLLGVKFSRLHKCLAAGSSYLIMKPNILPRTKSRQAVVGWCAKGYL